MKTYANILMSYDIINSINNTNGKLIYLFNKKQLFQIKRNNRLRFEKTMRNDEEI